MTLGRALHRTAAVGLLVARGAHATPLPESDVPYAGHAVVQLGGASLTLDGTRVLRADGTVLVDGLYAAPVYDGRTLCAADDGTNGLGRVRCWNTALQPTTVVEGGRPDRLALAGEHLAWVASPTGIGQVTIGWVDGRTPPRPLTNVGLQRVPGRAPDGWVPPPLGDSLRFDGAALRWDTPDGPRQAAWR